MTSRWRCAENVQVPSGCGYYETHQFWFKYTKALSIRTQLLLCDLDVRPHTNAAPGHWNWIFLKTKSVVLGALQDKFENPCDKALRRGSLTYTFAWMWGYHWCEKSFLWNDFEYRKKVSFYQLMIISAKIGVDWTKCVEELKKHSLLKFTIVNLCKQLNSAWAPLGVSSPNNVEQAAHFSSHFMMLFLHVL